MLGLVEGDLHGRHGRVRELLEPVAQEAHGSAARCELGQQRRRGPGEALPLPTGRLVEVESALRDTAEREDARTVDLALRHLAAAFGGREAPAVRSVLMTPGGVDVHLAAPTALPAPWTVTADTTIWTLHAERAAGRPPGERVGSRRRKARTKDRDG